MSKKHDHDWEAIRKLADPNLEPGEELVAVAFVEASALKPEILLGGVAAVVGSLIRRRKKADPPQPDNCGLPVPMPWSAVALTNRRLLVWSKDRTRFGAIVVADIEKLRAQRPKFTMSPLDGRLVLQRRGFDSIDVQMLRERAESMEKQFATLAPPLT